MDLIEPTLNCINGFALVLGLAIAALVAGLFFYRWLDENFEGLEDVTTDG